MEFASRIVRVPGLVPGREFELEVLADDSIIGPSIERDGTWEIFETTLFRAHLARMPAGGRVVDLGANIGWYSTLAILAGADVQAFEPVPGIADVAERNMQRAMEVGPGRGVLHRAAAGAERGTAEIALAARNRGDNRVLDDGNVPADLGDAETLTIDVLPVDEVVEGPARILKVDTQGSEWHALQGARRLLETSPELCLLVELWPYALRGAGPGRLLGFLEEQGFTLGKATAAPYPMSPERILRQVLARDPVKGGIDLYCTRGVPFHVGDAKTRLRSLWRRLKED
ncbi:MAG: FkbM family methyltransferase [Planctomycetota bacterium]|nr:FkbM family methyltransferase [Planctomycetota bacterium]